MRIILLGPPGSGKGTQGDLVSSKYGFARVSTGDILRQAVRERTALGLRAEAMMNQGILVSDDIVLELVRQRIASQDCRRGYILDGFPRNIHQAEELEMMEAGRPELALELLVDFKLLIQRLSARWVCPKCQAVYNRDVQPPRTPGVCDVCGQALVRREDDRPEVIAERLNVYKKESEPVRAFYKAKKAYAVVKAAGAVPEVFDLLTARIDCELAKVGNRTSGARG